MNMAASDLMLRLSEADFQQMIIDRAKMLGWLVYHTHDSRHSAAGFPDLVMARSGQVLFVEVKSEKGRVSKAQAEWLTGLAISSYGGIYETYIWRPSDMVLIEDALA